jgi:hypothetical protein
MSRCVNLGSLPLSWDRASPLLANFVVEGDDWPGNTLDVDRVL